MHALSTPTTRPAPRSFLRNEKIYEKQYKLVFVKLGEKLKVTSICIQEMLKTFSFKYYYCV